MVAILRHDDLHSATVTRLANASSHRQRDFDWLVELRIDREPGASPNGLPDDCESWLTDMRLLGMGPLVALADERDEIELRRS
jgi:hypothetical protein